MPFPEKVIERLEREPVRTPGWSGSLLAFSFAIFVIALVLWGGIKYGYETYLQKQVDTLDGQIKAFSQNISAADQARVQTFYSQISNIQKLTSGHIVASPVFDWLQATTLQSVYFSKFSLNAQTNQLSLTGVARTLPDVSSQITAFQGATDKVSKVTVSNVSMGQGTNWQFDIILTFVPGFLRQQAATASPALTQ